MHSTPLRRMNLLDVHNLTVRFPVRGGLPGLARQEVHAVEDVSFAIAPGETVGLVGESGCGKTTLGRAIVRLTTATSGRILFEGQEITQLKGRALRSLRRRLQIIFQDPYGSLDPRMRIGRAIGEPIVIHGLSASSGAREDRTAELLSRVGMDPSFSSRFPHQFSGGQRQRIGIARALAVEPKLIVCDEPVSALDVSIQAQIVNLLQDLQQEQGLSYLFIAHDLAVVEHLSHRILVMYLGRIVESGPASQICRFPRHPYTQALISAVPSMDPESKRERIILAGDVPSPVNPPSGCPFHPRCPVAEDRCRTDRPLLREIVPEHRAACHLA
jgi:oligopeptide transport system ATP-binding protein